MPPKDTFWTRKPHTAAKHDILRGYLGAWFPKLASWKKRVVFIDGFAGPGEYAGGEPGSPLIALNAAKDHRANLSSCELIFLFIEARRDRFEHLEDLIRRQKKPTHIRCSAIHGEFAKVVGKLLDEGEEAGKTLAPALVMVDPFGWSGLPFEVIERIAANPRSEVLISFMYEPIARFRALPNYADTFDSLFGCADWRDADRFDDADRKKDFLVRLYTRQLRDQAGMEFVRRFEMIDDGGRTKYFLIFGTHHIEGLKAMKRAMWRVDPSGRFRFSDATVSDQIALFGPQPDLDLLKRLILTRFGGQDVSVEQLHDFVVVDTPFMESHYKRQILIPMEKAGDLDVVSPREKRYSYPPRTVIRFP